MLKYKLVSKSGDARAGYFKTSKGQIETPVFMPVGTYGVVKTLSPEELKKLDVKIILGNTYHLYLRPGKDVINIFNGLHNFMNWDGFILTDSGGFQIFSLSKFGRITKKGFIFNSHLDGSKHILSPEKSIKIQSILNSDIMMCLDQCIKFPNSFKKAEEALIITNEWAKRCKKFWIENGKKNDLFGILQGGMYKDLRTRAVREITSIDFSGYALGGLSVGEPKNIMEDIVSYTLSMLPDDKPRYVMGVGTPENIIELINLGVDMFDCVIPTRNGRNGQFFVDNGKINILNAKYKKDNEPIDINCNCYTCLNYSKSYLRYLFISKEILSYRLNTIHNINYYMKLVNGARNAIIKKSFEKYRKNFYYMRKK